MTGFGCVLVLQIYAPVFTVFHLLSMDGTRKVLNHLSWPHPSSLDACEVFFTDFSASSEDQAGNYPEQ